MRRVIGWVLVGVALPIACLLTFGAAMAVLVLDVLRDLFPRHQHPARHMPRWWVATVYHLCVRPITWIGRDWGRTVDPTSGHVLVSMNHGTLVEQFMGIWAAMDAFPHLPLMIVGKRELLDGFWTRWLFAEPMMRLGAIVMIDRNDRQQALHAITQACVSKMESPRLWVILVDGTRPTNAKRDRDATRFGIHWRRTCHPRVGGDWQILTALDELLETPARHYWLQHGLSVHNNSWGDLWKVVGATHHVLMDHAPPTPATREAHAADLVEWFHCINAWLTNLERR